MQGLLDSFLRLPNQTARRLVWAYFASHVGDFMVLAAMPFVVAAVGGGPKDLGFVLAAQAVAVTGALLFGGVLGDRRPKRSVMIAADVLRLGSQAAIAALLLAGEATLPELLLSQLLHGIGTGLFTPASEAILPDVLDDQLVQDVTGAKQQAWAVGVVAGPALAAAVVAIGGPGWAMAVDGATFAASALMVLGVPAVMVRKVAERRSGSWRGEISEGYRAFRRLPWLEAVVLQWTVINALVFCPFFVLGPVVSEDLFGGASAWAVMLAVMGTGQFAGGWAARRWRARRPLVEATGMACLWVIPTGLLAAAAPLALLVPGLVVGGFGLSVFDTLWKTTMQKNTPQAERARLMSFDQFGGFVAVPLGFLVGSLIEGSIGARLGFLGGMLILLGSAVAVLAVRSVRELRLPEQVDEAAAATVPSLAHTAQGGSAARRLALAGTAEQGMTLE